MANFASFIMAVSLAVVVFLASRNNSVSNRLLALYFILLGFIQFQFFVANTEFEDLSMNLFVVFAPVFWSVAPVKYLYIKSIGRGISNRDVLHFLPAIILLLFLLIIRTLFFDKVTDNAFVFLIVTFITVLVFQFVFYLIKMYREVKAHQKRVGNIFSSPEGVSLQWMKLGLWGFIFYFLFSVINELFSYPLDNISMPILYAIYIFYLAIYGMRQESQLSDILHLTNENSVSLDEVIEEKNGKYPGSSLKDIQKTQSILTELENHLVTQKAFKNPNLNLMDLSREIGVNYKYISQVINTEYKQNFQSLIGSYRVNEAKRLMNSDDYKDETLEGIGEMAGFKSKSTFYSSFNRFEGKTPKQFRDEMT